MSSAKQRRPKRPKSARRRLPGRRSSRLKRRHARRLKGLLRRLHVEKKRPAGLKNSNARPRKDGKRRRPRRGQRTRSVNARKQSGYAKCKNGKRTSGKPVKPGNGRRRFVRRLA
jgi:hypothetical protein